MTCPRCGASSRAGASWCSQCHAAFAATAADDAVPSRWVPAPAAPSAVAVYSRWRGGTTTFGPVGRLSCTLAVLLLAAFAVVSGDPFFMAIWILFVGPMILRSVWKLDRIA